MLRLIQFAFLLAALLFAARVADAAELRVPTDATAFPRRDVEFVVNVHTRWRDPAQDTACIDWARDLFQALAPHAMGSVYVNFMPADETDRVPGAFGSNYARLAEAKRRYDPQNLFRMNQNILLAA